MAVECEGRALAATVAPAGFVAGVAVVTVAGLSPATAYTLRCRCEVEDPDVDPNALWCPPVAVATLSVEALEVGAGPWTRGPLARRVLWVIAVRALLCS